ncbi:hypothetical protein BGX28_007189 [Mortierella sp. GBA30]|nr:hypothetical protein BGX28_007189 [Mortierella sp. GBA30]
MTPTVDILPFVTPVADPSITDIDFSVAVDDWNDTLSRILKLNTKAFWTVLLTNASLARFLDSFLGEYATFRGNKGDIWVMELEEVVRRVLMIYRRIAETMSEPVAMQVSGDVFADQEDMSDPGSALLDLGLVSTSVLMDLAGIYGTADPEGISKLIGSLLQNTPRLINDFRDSTGTVVQIIRKVQKKFEKGVSGGAGKGKGKGKGLSPAASPEPGMPELDEERLAEAIRYVGVLSNISYALDAVSAASPLLAIELQQHPLFLQCLSGCYNYTLPVLSKMLIDSRVGGESRAQSMLGFLRLKMLSIVNNILDGIYKHQLQASAGIPFSEETSVELDDDNTAVLTDSLCGVIVGLYEQSPLQEHMAPMSDAPIVLDLEIQFCISEKFSDIIVNTFRGENDRLNHWVVMLSDLRNFNPATQTYIYEHNMRKSEKMAREMSTGIYINNDKDRSGSTITSDTSIPRTTTHMSVVQEEDYVKRTMLISQLQDLFPDLGDGFLEACLITFKDDPEVVTMRLLEEDLPSDLATMDRSTARSLARRTESNPTSMALVKASAPAEPEEQDVLSTRRNIFDGDEFDMFSGNVVDKSKISRGKRGPKDAEVVLDDKTFVSQHKSAILQAVDTMYDDEYDDTYDSMGLNNTGADFKLVDDIDAKTDEGVTRHTVGRAQMQIDPSIEHEEVLINMYTGQKEVFNRSAEARRSKKRQEIRNLTQMSDEQLEGWAIMFGRNPRKAEIAQKYEFSGQQTELVKAEPIDRRRGGRMPFVDKNASQQQRRQDEQAPQHGRSSPAPKKPQISKPQQQRQQQQQQQQPSQTPKPSTNNSNSNNGNPSARDRAKNERQKSSKANHNRRDQHAKKMASMNP